MKKQEQLPLLEAQTTWFHVFKSMLDSGDIAKMGPYATTVYLAIKAHTNWTTGKSWPGIETIMQCTGISRIQVIRSLKILEEHNYLDKEKSGRKNVYFLREKIPVYEVNSTIPVAEASWGYLPSKVQEAVAELKKFTVTGNKDGINIINIENFTLNLQQNIDCGTVIQNNGGGSTSLDEVAWDNIPDDNPVKRAYLADKRARQE